MTTSNPLFTVGATVFTEGGQERKIAKFYKNGNFVLVDDNQQYRPDGDIAWRTGDTSWSGDCLYGDTPEHRARFIAEAKLDVSREVIRTERHRLERILVYAKGNPDTANAEAERIVKANAERAHEC